MFMLLSSLFIISNAIDINKYHPSSMVANVSDLIPHALANKSKDNIINQILMHEDNAESDKSLIDIFSKLDPAEIEKVVNLVQALLSTSQADLDRITSASTEADKAYTAAVNSHNAASVAQTDGVALAKSTLDNGVAASLKTRDTGVANLRNEHEKNVAKLQATYDGIVKALQKAVDTASAARKTTSAAKAEANAILNQEKTRLDTEISSLNQVIALLHGVRGHKIIIGRPLYLEQKGSFCQDPSGKCIERFASDSEKHAVSCCSDSVISGWANLCKSTAGDPINNRDCKSCDIYAARTMWSEGCQTLNWKDADSFCSSKGGRLCTVEEIKTSCYAGVGCLFDAMLVWTSDKQ